MLTGCKRQKRMVGARADREKLKFRVQGAQREAGRDSGSLPRKVSCGSDSVSADSGSCQVILA